MELRMNGGGAPVKYKNGTAKAEHVLASETFIAGSRELKTGTMKDCGDYQYAGMGEGPDYYTFNKAPAGFYHASSGNEGWAPELRVKKTDVRNYLQISAAKIAQGSTIAGVGGTFIGNRATIAAEAARGYGASSSYWDNGEEQGFTMPANGVVYYGGMSAAYRPGSGTATICEIWKNGTRMDERNIVDSNYLWRGTMFNKAFSASKGDRIIVKAYAYSGVASMSCMQAVIVYGN